MIPNASDPSQAGESKRDRALRMIASHAASLGEGPVLSALRLLGLFDRPAPPGAIASLREKPVIPGLTDGLMTKAHWWSGAEPISEEAWQAVLAELRDLGFLLPAEPHQPGTLSLHPLARVHFKGDLETHHPKAWKAGNLRLYEHLRNAAPDQPDTLEAMEPLFAAVVHGCRAGRQHEAFNEVYWRRIQRESGFATSQLGAFNSALVALTGFFDRPWTQPSANLPPRSQAYALSEVGFILTALGRLPEAMTVVQECQDHNLAAEDWESFAVQVVILIDLTLALGDVADAVSFAEQRIESCGSSGTPLERLANRAKLADALHQSGRWEESAAAFREAEAIQAEWQPEYPRLYALQGYHYCDLLLSRGGEACQEVRDRAEQTLEWMQEAIVIPRDTALVHLSLGRAHLGLADVAKAAEHLEQAVEGLRRSGEKRFLPPGLLARAALRRSQGDLPGAEADLSEALEIAEQGSMRLYECDAHLEWARLCGQQGDREGLERHVARARTLVAETGYERRRREVDALAPNPSSPGEAG